MTRKRLTEIVPESRKYIAINVVVQLDTLIASAIMLSAICYVIASLVDDTYEDGLLTDMLIIAGIAIFICIVSYAISWKLSYMSGRTVKRKLREQIYQKLLRLGLGYRQEDATDSIIDLSVNGVEQIEAYVGSFLPQFYYAILATVAIFVFMCFLSPITAMVSLVFVFMIWAFVALMTKKTGRTVTPAASLGDAFINNIMGMTTLKIYGSDGYANDKMCEDFERYQKEGMRKTTARLHTMLVMDLMAYGGAAVGIVVSALQFHYGMIELYQCLTLIILSSSFLLPLRRLGKYYRSAIEGTKAAEDMFALLDLPEPEVKDIMFPINSDLRFETLSYSYDDREVLHNIDMLFENRNFTSIVGDKGCGKSTIASIIVGRIPDYTGKVLFNDTELSEINETSLMRSVTFVDHESYLFEGTVRSNLKMGSPDCSDETIWNVLRNLNLEDLLKSREGLDTELKEGMTKISRGQRQRLVIARALLHDSEIYVFDEVTTNIDTESEAIIMRNIEELAQHRTVILMSERLANVKASDKIYVMDNGRIIETGNHEQLMSRNGIYSRTWAVQEELENYHTGGAS